MTLSDALAFFLDQAEDMSNSGNLSYFLSHCREDIRIGESRVFHFAPIRCSDKITAIAENVRPGDLIVTNNGEAASKIRALVKHFHGSQDLRQINYMDAEIVRGYYFDHRFPTTPEQEASAAETSEKLLKEAKRIFISEWSFSNIDRTTLVKYMTKYNPEIKAIALIG